MPESHPEDIAPETEETLDDLIERLEGAVRESTQATVTLGGHVQSLVENIAKLAPLAAAKEIPEATRDAIADLGNVGNEVSNAAGSVLETAPAAATDALETLDKVQTKLRRGLRKRR